MSQAATPLDRFPAIEHLVLLRVFDDQGVLRAVLPNTADAGPLRVLHGVQDRDGAIGPEEARKGLQALPPHPAAAEVRALLEGVTPAARLRLAAIASPVPGLLGRIAGGGATAEDAEAFVALLNAGDVRAAEKVGGQWQPQPYVIDGILAFFGVSKMRRMVGDTWDKVPLKTANYTDADFEAGGVRYAPGCIVRTGCYIGPGTVIMNQAFVNIGAYIAGQGVMIDGAARVASCAQFGTGVKFGAGSGIEGILEPAGRLPSIVEDDAKIGAMCEVSGIVGEGAVLASGVVMASGKRIFDESTGKLVEPLEVRVGERTYLVPRIPPYRLAVGGALLAEGGKYTTDAIILKAGDLRDRATLRHFEKQGVLYQ